MNRREQLNHIANVSANIQQCRHDAGLTQAELAAKMGIAQARIAEWENEDKDPTASSLIRIAIALNIKPAELLR